MNDHATAPSRAEHQARMAEYLKAGEARARAIGNKGPVRFGPDGKLHADIVDAYWKHGFYIFEGVVDAAEIEELRADAMTMLERAPATPGARLEAADCRMRSNSLHGVLLLQHSSAAIARCFIANNAQSGLAADNCAVELDRCRLEHNGAHGVRSPPHRGQAR